MSNQSVWNQHYQRERAQQFFPDENVVRLLRKKFTTRYGNALDLGTGSGRHLPLLVEHFATVVACDFSRESLYITPKEQCLKVQAALPHLPFSAETFDFILCWGVLHYLDEGMLRPAIAGIYEILKPKGSIFLTLRSAHDTHLAMQLARGDLAGGQAQLFTRDEALALFSSFRAVDYGFIARQPLGEEGVVAHHMLYVQK